MLHSVAMLKLFSPFSFFHIGDAFTKPILEYDGTTICGNTAISKFVAEKHGKLRVFLPLVPMNTHDFATTGLAGENEEMRQAAYEIVELTEGIWDKLSSCFWERDEEKKVKILLHNKVVDVIIVFRHTKLCRKQQRRNS